MTKTNFLQALVQHRELWWRLSERAVESRYKGSAIGLSWSVVQPLVMLAVYTFVFSTIFKSRWNGAEEGGSLGYAINLFAGLIVFNLFSDCAGTAPTLVINNKNYVTKVIFPLELLGATTVAAASFQALVSSLILAAFDLMAFGKIPVSFALLPLVWLPLELACLAITWSLCALGVFLRDTEQIMPIAINATMFLSAVFYPINALPLKLQPIMNLNPLAIIIEQTRLVAIQGDLPSPKYLLIGTGLGLAAAEIAFRAFNKARRGFADVI